MSTVYDQLKAEQRERLKRIDEIKEQLEKPEVKNNPAKNSKLKKEKDDKEAEATRVGQVLRDAGITNINKVSNE
jgi:hypothetical protein